MPISPEDSAVILAVRQKVLAGTDTPDDLKQAIAIFAKDRAGAVAGANKARESKAADAKPVDTQALLAGLKGLVIPPKAA